jgi:hypothetical protein
MNDQMYFAVKNETTRIINTAMALFLFACLMLYLDLNLSIRFALVTAVYKPNIITAIRNIVTTVWIFAPDPIFIIFKIFAGIDRMAL